MTATSAEPTVPRSESAFTIPVVDLTRFLDGDATSRTDVANALTQAFKYSGFVYIKGHGIPKEKIDATFKLSANFFELPLEVKDRLEWTDPRSNRGYVADGRERVTNETSTEEIAALHASSPDHKECMQIGKEDDPTWPNPWPEEDAVPGFRETMNDFFRRAHLLHMEIMRALALGLGLDERFFDDKGDEEWHTLRLLHYPPVPARALEGGGSRAGAHTDYGSITLLFQDNVGGLEVQNPYTGEFHPATPIEDTIVVNAGDLLERWSNDTLRSTMHRVVAPPGQSASSSGMTAERYSIAYFCNPNEHEVIECLPTCYDEKRPKRYGPVTTGTYLEQRLSATHK